METQLDSTIETIIGQNFKNIAEQDKKQLIAGVKNNVARLIQIKLELRQQEVLEQKRVGVQSQLHHILNESSVLIANKVNDQNKERIKDLVFEAYHLTTTILNQLGIIRHIEFTVTYIDKDGRYIRLEDYKIDSNQTGLYKETSNNSWRLKIQESEIRKRAKEIQEQQENVSLHYKDFIEPFKEAEQNASKPWKMNNGKAVEAFERHWEELGHSLEKSSNLSKKDLGPTEKRWALYILSSGNDPFFTGPDTLYSQVKNANASIIGNINTIIMTIDAILKLVTTDLNDDNYQKYLKAFQQKGGTTKITKKLKDVIPKDIQNFVEEELKKYSKVNNPLKLDKS